MAVQDPVFAAERSAQFATLRRRIEEGMRCVERRDAAGAIEAFAAAYAIAAAWEFGDDVTLGTLVNLAGAYSLAGDYRRALDAYLRALSLPGLAPAQRANVLNWIGTVHARMGDLSMALAHYARAYRLARRCGQPRLQALAAANAALSYRRRAGPRFAARAYRWARRGVAAAAAADAAARQFAELQLAAAALALGRRDEAAELLARLQGQGLEPDDQAELWRLQAELAAWRGDRAGALRAAARAADLAVWARSPEDLAEAWIVLERLGVALADRAEREAGLRLHQEQVAAFLAASRAARGEEDGERLALLYVAADGLVLAREGHEEVLGELAAAGVVVGARAGTPGAGPLAAAAWQPLQGGGAGAGHVVAVPGPAALARAVAELADRVYRDRVAESRRSEEELTLAKLSAFHDVALALGRPLETDELAAELLATTRRLVGSSAAALVMVERDGLWAEGLPRERLAELPVVRRVAETGRAALLDAGRPEGRQLLAPLGVGALLAVPVYFGSAACGAVLLAARAEPHPFSERDLELLTFLSKQFGLALENAALRDDLRRRLEALTQDLLVARRLQVALMPQGPVRAGPLAIAGLSLPAKHVGGDVFDYARLPDGSWVVFLGDVMGKGVGAAILGSILHTRVRQLLAAEPFGPELVGRLAGAMWEDLDRGQALATAVLVHVDPARGRLAVATAGHPPPLRWARRGWQALGRGGGAALGLRPSGGPVGYAEFPLDRPGAVLLYSDGLGELLLGRRGLLRGEEVAEHLGRLGIAPAGGDPEALLARVRALARGRELTDDVTVVAVQVEAAGTGRAAPPGHGRGAR